MKPLSKGDTVKVRLHTGEVVEAIYGKIMAGFYPACND